MIANQYVLEARYMDKLNRVRKKVHVGVYKSLQDLEEIKDKWQTTMNFIKSDKKLAKYNEKYSLSYKIYTNYDPFCA